MNLRRGLFRLWLVGAALWVLAVAFIGYGQIMDEFHEIALWNWVAANDGLVVPQRCGEARGVAGTDYGTQEGRGPGPWDTDAKPNPSDSAVFPAWRQRPCPYVRPSSTVLAAQNA